MPEQSAVLTFLFTDIEGSTRLWEEEPVRMRDALASHDSITRHAVEAHNGIVVKMLGDGVHAAFEDPSDALRSALHVQRALAEPGATHGLPISVRCGLHLGIDERRDNDFFGSAVNRAARLMNAAHGGQVLLSETLAHVVGGNLPEGLGLRDLGVVRLRDLARTERVYQLMHAELRSDFPALRTLESTPNNLPHHVTSFVGRDRDIGNVAALLERQRLVTLIGVGGIGKTRLSIQVAADVMDRFADGVWLVELAPLSDPRLVAQGIASVVGVKEEAGRPITDTLVKHLKDRKLLLVLDNCEHLVRACAEVARSLLSAVGGLRILASSREHLRVGGESVYVVPTLAVPEPSRTIDLPALTQYEAVRLFADRASAAQPGFRVSEDNAADVIRICRRLDGIPLALELAAARMRALSVTTLASRLDDRFRLLSTGDPAAMPRQQTLRALIDWSYDLLTDAERAVLCRLAVFAGSWTLEAAEAVVAGDGVDRADVLDLLTRLVEKSLVVLDAQGSRYGLLETVREYAREKLQESGAAAVHARHLAYYLAFAEQARAGLVGPEQGAWLTRLDLERENILAAHEWAATSDSGAPLGLKLVCAVKLYWLNRGLIGLGRRITDEALARPGAQAPTLDRCRTLLASGQLAFLVARYADARKSFQEGLAIARSSGEGARTATLLEALGMALMGEGALADARTFLEEALVLARNLGGKREVAVALNELAQLHRLDGDLDTAIGLYEDALGLARELGDQESIAVGLLNLAMACITRRALDRARALTLDVIAIASQIGSRQAGQCVLEVTAGLACVCQEGRRAARFFGAAEAIAEETGIRRHPADEAFLAPLIARVRFELGPAFVAADLEGRALAYDAAIRDAKDWLEGGSS